MPRGGGRRASVHGLGSVHADLELTRAVADAVVQGKSAEGLLDAYGGGSAGVQCKAIQRKDVPTHYGTFKSTKFAKLADGVDIVLAREVSRQQTTIILRGKNGEPFWKLWSRPVEK